MPKIHPQTQSSSASCYVTSKQETFTIWMKSLVLSGKGCTVFDSNGQIVYRVDNYNSKCRDEVYLMDFKGLILFTIQRKKFKMSRFWEGYRSTTTEINQQKPCFQVRKASRISVGSAPFDIILGLDKNQPYRYRFESWTCKSECKIVDQFGGTIAELKRKKSTCGVDLGNDVLTMVVEPNINLSLIMGLVVVYNLIQNKM
ncbi:Protein LURP-one-related like [Quillaja saponaria]|uniref:Protein LURP-one-related like n=1 Tax=Quillaja saponaria TaxID=32244 RepID=A0AAD7L4I5_QUISA|nr:Protein LURP-one-related like [Quillaja saponaria]